MKKKLNKKKKKYSPPNLFWKKQAEYYTWYKPYKKISQGKFSDGIVKWFTGAQLNITENCLDRHLKSGDDKTALIWESNNPDEKGITYTYKELYEEVCRISNILKKYKVKKGDFVCIYMPMIPQTIISMLACARIGAVHNVIFAGFSATSLAEKMKDSNCHIIITSDFGYRGNKKIAVKENVDEALKIYTKISKVLVFSRDNNFAPINGNEISLNEELKNVSLENFPEKMNSEDPLFVLYTSGSTGKPKGILHSIGGYMVYAGYSFKKVFGYKTGEVYWCTADLGWITGHTYGVYGPLLLGATIVLFEGVPTYPNPSRYWQIIEKYKVNIFYTAPTVIRSLASYGLDYINKFKLESLRILGSVGEPLNVEAWHWYYNNVGKKRCKIVDTWWQTETGGILISPQNNFISEPCSAGKPLPGIDAIILNEKGGEIKETKTIGYLCIKKSWPGMSIGILNDKNKFFKEYFSKFKGYYLSGDMAMRDQNKCYHIMGRSDDVINVSGHRFGSAEIESAINSHSNIAESSVVSYPHQIKGSGIYAFVILYGERSDVENLKSELIELVKKTIGHIAQLDKIQIVKDLPKTRSGKIVRRILKKMASGESYENEDLTTLINFEVTEEIKNNLL
jgi:acetyl-CoA synthetase